MVESDSELVRTLVDESVATDAEGDVRTRPLHHPDAPAGLGRIEQLGRFEITREIGRGGTGCVFEAWDPARGEKVAVKLLLGLHSSAFYRFKREFRGLAEVSHPNLVKLHELFYDEGRMFFSMELLEGRDFVAALRSDPKIDYARLRDALRQLVQGVNALHAAGKLHRDIKPPNIMITSAGRVVLLDFGLIRERDERDDTTRAVPGALLGTPAYMSPEQVSGFDLGPASDWYAVGLVLFEAATGRRPFIENGREEIMRARLVDDAPTLASIVGEVPADLNNLCAELLRRHPGDRPEPARLLRLVGAEPSAPVSTKQRGAGAHFVGRERELLSAREILGRVSRDAPACILVRGPSGIGKSEFIRKFLSEAADAYGVSLSGRCYERESIPYKAFDAIVDSIAGHLREREKRGRTLDRPRVVPTGTNSLVRLFPTLELVAGATHDGTDWADVADDHELRAHAFTALKRLLNDLALDGPLVVTIEDLQWCDMDSVALLLEVLRPPDTPAMLFVGSHRSQQANSNPALRSFLDAIRSPRHPIVVEEIELGPLETDERLELAKTLLSADGPGSGDRAQSIAEESDGSPFFLAELALHTRRDQESTSPRPRSISLDDLVERRIRALPEGAQQVLRAISVAGHRIEQGVALRAGATQRPERSTFDILRSENLIRSQGVNDRDWVEPFHDRIRECVLRSLDEQELRSAHLGLAEALADSGRADPNALATHFAQAGAGERTVTHALGAAAAAANALAFIRAVEWLEVALARLDADDPRRAGVEVSLARAYGSAGHAYEAAEAYTRAASQSPEAERPALHQGAAFLLVSAGNLAEARKLLNELLINVDLSLPVSPARALASLLWLRVRIALRGLEYEERQVGELSQESLHRIDLCWAAGHLVAYDRIVGGGFIARHLLLALDAGEPSRIAPALAMEAVARFLRGSEAQDDALALLRSADEIARRCESDEARAWVANVKPPISLFMGKWEEAMTQAREAAELLFRHASAAGAAVMTNRYLELWAKVQTGDWEELEVPLRQLLHSGGRANALHWGIRGLLAAPVALAKDLPHEAIAEFEAYRDSPPADVYGSNQITMASGTVSAYLYVGEVEKAWEFVEDRRDALERALRISDSLSRCVYQSARAQAALAWARSQRAPRPTRAARVALRRLEQTGLAMARATSLLGLAALADMSEDSATAERLCTQSVAAFDALGMKVHAAVSKYRLGELLGTQRGRLLRAEAEQSLRDRGVQQPTKLVQALSGGFRGAG
jgi:serine/threonine protein kinase/tetratricopeptide (TPR) repeat protein